MCGGAHSEYLKDNPAYARRINERARAFADGITLDESVRYGRAEVRRMLGASSVPPPAEVRALPDRRDTDDRVEPARDKPPPRHAKG